MINGDRAGDRVFTDIDEALAAKIISRSRENAGDMGRVGEEVADNGDDSCGGRDPRRDTDTRRAAVPGGLSLVAVIAAVAAAAIILKLFFGRGNGRK